jgi:tetratricopeptide (TPR) repeat protein
MIVLRRLVVFAVFLLTPSFAFAEWYDDYENGMKAADRANWSAVISSMNAAIAKKPNEGRHKSYGTIFVDYYPYYYRGIALFETGDFRRALDDLERTKGTGRVKLGSADSYIRRANERLTVPATPVPTAQPTAQPTRDTVRPSPTPIPTRPPITPQPATPFPTLPDSTSVRDARARAERILNQARQARLSAQREVPSSAVRPEFSTGQGHLGRAERQLASADSVQEWDAIADSADAARVSFDQALSRARAALNQGIEDITRNTRQQVRNALEAYFDGRFDEAARLFNALTRADSDNALLWAFYGASLYSSYYIDGERNTQARLAAENAFRKAKPRMTDLPSRYFSPRIRRFYRGVR